MERYVSDGDSSWLKFAFPSFCWRHHFADVRYVWFTDTDNWNLCVELFALFRIWTPDGIRKMWYFEFRNLICLRECNLGFEVLTPVVMKSSIFWDITACSPLRVNWCWTAWNLVAKRSLLSTGSACHLLSLWFLAWLILLPWRWRWYISWKRWLTVNGL
jgi:hypothetical protein